MPDTPAPAFGPWVRRALLLVLLVVFARVVLWPLLAPVVLAVVARIVFSPVHGWLAARLAPGRADVAAGVSLLLLVLGVLLPATGAGFLFVVQAQVVLADLVGMQEGVALTTRLASLVDRYLEWLQRLGARYLPAGIDLRQVAQERLQEAAGQLYASLPGLVELAGEILLGLLVFLLTLYFLFRDGHRISGLLVELAPLQREHSRRILARLEQTVEAVFVGALLTALFQGTLGGLAFFLAGFSSFVIWGALIAVCSFVPVVGTALVWAPAAVFLRLGGQLGPGLLLLAFGAVIATTDNLLRVVFLRGRMPLHPLLLFLAVFGGLLTAGPMGIIYGLLLTAACVEGVALYRERPGATSAAGG
jgi:predicted PurR-regulated permease PerM